MGENETSYKGAVVSAEVAKELQKKPVADFLHFEEGHDGNMIMTAKMPEWGRMGDKVFRIRENLNYFMRGLARSCLDKNGKYNADKAQSVSDDLVGDNEGIEGTLKKGKVSPEFLKQCGVPKDRIKDFTSFVSVCKTELEMMAAFSGREIDDLRIVQYNMEHVNDEPDLTSTREKLVADSYQDFKNILDNYQRMARMDPQKETNLMFAMISQNYAGWNMAFSNYSNEYHKSRGEAMLTGVNHTTKFKSDKRKFDAQNSFITTVNIGGKNKVISLEAADIPSDKLVTCSRGTRTGVGVYDSVEALEEYHKRNCEAIIPDEEKLKKCKQIGRTKREQMVTIAPSGNFEKEHAAQLRHAALKETFQENVRLIQKTIPEFTITDEEIEKYISPERIALHDRAVKIGEAREEVLEVKNAPASFARIKHVLLDRSGTPEGKAHNEKTARLLTDPSKAGDDFRKELFAEISNRVQTIDAEKMDPKLPLDARMKYCLDNTDLFELGFEFQKLSDKDNLADMGFKIPAPQVENHKKIVDKAVVLGGEGGCYRETAANDFFLTFPFESLTVDQIGMLLPQEKDFKKEPGAKNNKTINRNASLPLFITFGEHALAREDYEEPQKHDYKKDELPQALPPLNETRKKFKDIYTNLKNADNWYNLRNSDAYKRLLTSLKGLNDAYFEVEEGSFSDEQKADLAQKIQSVKDRADEYIQHVGQAPKNDIQQYRLDLAKALKADTEFLLSPAEDMPGKMLEQQVDEYNATAGVDAYYKPVKKNLGYSMPSARKNRTDLTEEQRQEIIFKEGLERTENLRKETNILEKKGSLNNKQKLELEADRLALNARDELTNMVGRTEIDREKAKSLLATVMMTTAYKLELKKSSSKMGKIETYIKDALNSPAFSDVTGELTNEKINDFLAGSGEKNMLKAFNERLNTKKQSGPQTPVEEKKVQKTETVQEKKVQTIIKK